MSSECPYRYLSLQLVKNRHFSVLTAYMPNSILTLKGHFHSALNVFEAHVLSRQYNYIAATVSVSEWFRNKGLIYYVC